jgi:hypothetical protein
LRVYDMFRFQHIEGLHELSLLLDLFSISLDDSKFLISCDLEMSRIYLVLLFQPSHEMFACEGRIVTNTSISRYIYFLNQVCEA